MPCLSLWCLGVKVQPFHVFLPIRLPTFACVACWKRCKISPLFPLAKSGCRGGQKESGVAQCVLKLPSPDRYLQPLRRSQLVASLTCRVRSECARRVLHYIITAGSRHVNGATMKTFLSVVSLFCPQYGQYMYIYVCTVIREMYVAEGQTGRQP